MKLEIQSIESFLDLRFLTWGLAGAGMVFLLAAGLPFFGEARPWAVFFPEAEMLPEIKDSPAFESLRDFEKVFEQSSLFGLLNTQKNTLVPRISIAELSKDLRLKGVVLGGEPEAILEDARTQQSLFVKKGDEVGGLAIQEIRADAVVLAAQGEEKELRLEG